MTINQVNLKEKISRSKTHGDLYNKNNIQQLKRKRTIRLVNQNKKKL